MIYIVLIILKSCLRCWVKLESEKILDELFDSYTVMFSMIRKESYYTKRENGFAVTYDVRCDEFISFTLDLS